MIDSAITDIAHLFKHFGDKTYGEACDQLTHAISSAWHAQQQNAPQTMVCAAFLHDIGHFIADKNQLAGLDQWGHIDHDILASNWLQQKGFAASVYLPIRYHIEAKRYAARRSGTDALSNASRQTLQQQGGPMTDSEARDFEQLACFSQAMELRRYDDLGKPHQAIDTSLSPWLAITKQVLTGN
ncbi:phosphohydrolase [Pseudoalteromonas luteoviolacea]|uniref:phosphohydrolase n=1 Tax=Pseudoalteromonas luteoviolacea TaxID=43657 RepID=UPI001B380A1B|nr:phosphohydrolase [Pseudoalteromonas luteoviolacea]MBQ4837476.1 phosphohydrolase [Pseudoalteromonas luteoviolacea]